MKKILICKIDKIAPSKVYDALTIIKKHNPDFGEGFDAVAYGPFPILEYNNSILARAKKQGIPVNPSYEQWVLNDDEDNASEQYVLVKNLILDTSGIVAIHYGDQKRNQISSVMYIDGDDNDKCHEVYLDEPFEAVTHELGPVKIVAIGQLTDPGLSETGE